MQRRGFLGAALGLAMVGPAALADPPYRMPQEAGPFRAPELVELTTLDASIHLDIRYATTDNFLHRKVYGQARAFLQRPAAAALVRVHKALASDGYGLIVFDAYRPWSVTRMMAEASPAGFVGTFVADPNQGSRHNRGCAVDCSLYKGGQPVDMPTSFDDFTARAHAHDTTCSAAQQANRSRLQAAMQKEGFLIYEAEWWHFDYQDWKHYAVMDIPFDKL